MRTGTPTGMPSGSTRREDAGARGRAAEAALTPGGSARGAHRGHRSHPEEVLSTVFLWFNVPCHAPAPGKGVLSSGQEIICSFAVKPTSSILNTRETVNKQGQNTKISVKGRHDPCVGIRAVPIGEAMLACILLDHYLMHKAQCGK